MLRLSSDKAIVSHFQTYYQDWFPNLKDRSAFARQVANLWRVKLQLQDPLLHQEHVQEHWIQPVDTLPLPVCAKVRARRDRVCSEQGRKSFCAAKDTFYYGFKLGLRVTLQGLIAHHALLEANTNDSRHLPALVEQSTGGTFQGIVPVDKGFFDPTGWRLLWGRGTHIVGQSPKKVDKHRPAELPLPEWFERFCALARKQVEGVAGLLCSRFAVDRIRAHDQWHFEHRLLRKILAFNLLVVCNLRLKRSPLDLDGLVRD